MNLFTDRPLSLPVFSQEPELVILVREDRPPEIRPAPGQPIPDRHMLVGLMQAASVALEEHDRESVVCIQQCLLRLDDSEAWQQISAGLVVVKPTEGPFGVLAIGGDSDTKRIARQALRWFTGRIRLDIP